MIFKKRQLTNSDLKNSYSSLVTKSELDFDFIILVAAAAAICSFGFRMNSPSVIVGAMVVSPLLFSIVSIGASLYRQKWRNTLLSMRTLAIGIVIAIIVCIIINIIFPISAGTEIIDRIISSPVDYFFVAFLSGLSGTFAFFWPDIIEAIAGIAISVALIPPVVMLGIGIASVSMPIIVLSSVIVIINILGILLGSFFAVAGLELYTSKGND